MGYLHEAVRGVSWVGAFRATTRGISFFRTILLARILSPVQFGVFGIASLAITFLEILLETGVNVVLIQKKEGINEYINTAWVVSIFRGVIISFILIVAAPLISSFFASPGTTNLIYLISLVSFIRGFINPAIVNFMKDLRFKEEFLFKFVIFAFDSTIAVIMSLVLKSATGIVMGLIAGALLELIFSFIFISPRPKFEYDAKKLKDILSKGKWVTGAGIFQFFFKQGDDAVVGRVLGESSLGVYQVAYKLSSLPISEITDVFGRVTFPLYVKISEDKKRLTKAFLKTTSVVAILALVLGGVLFFFGETIIRVFLGDAWNAAVPLVKILSIFGMIQAITNSVNSFLLAIEKQNIVTAITFISILGLFISIFPLISLYGLVGASFAPLVGSVISLPFMIFFTIRSLRQYGKN